MSGGDHDNGRAVPVEPARHDGASGAEISRAGAADRSPRRGEWLRAAVRRYERPLTNYAGHVCGDAERARDIVQETFIRLCAQDESRIGARLAEWLYTVCRNLSIDARRKERRMSLMSDLEPSESAGHNGAPAVTDFRSEFHAGFVVSPDPSPPEAAERDESVSRVLRSLEDLPDNQRDVIRLKFQHGLSYKQISQVTHLSVTNVGFLIHTGLKTLRQRLAVDDAR